MFNRTQNIIKEFLPDRVYKLLYNFAWRFYLVWSRISDDLHFASNYLFSLFGKDMDKVNKYKIIYSIRPYTMVGRSGLHITYDLVSDAEKNNLEGSFVECGVARGGCSAMMAMIARNGSGNRNCWLFDTFEGLPAFTNKDELGEMIYSPKEKHAALLAEGYCLGSFEEVEELLFSRLSLKRENIFMIKGLFQDTLPIYKNKIGPIAVLRLDADWYESTKCCLENLYNKVVSGGSVILDDYAAVLGCKKAADEFLENNNINVEMSFDNRGGCYFIKP